MEKSLLDEYFVKFGKIKNMVDFKDESVHQLLKEYQHCINANYYPCDDFQMSCLANVYDADPKFTNYMDNIGGTGTTKYIIDAINYWYEVE